MIRKPDFPRGDGMEPKHRRCVKPRHHQWKPVGQSWTGWVIFECAQCGKRDI